MKTTPFALKLMNTVTTLMSQGTMVFIDYEARLVEAEDNTGHIAYFVGDAAEVFIKKTESLAKNFDLLDQEAAVFLLAGWMDEVMA